MGTAAAESIRRICRGVADTWNSIYRELATDIPPVLHEMKGDGYRTAALSRKGDAECKIG